MKYLIPLFLLLAACGGTTQPAPTPHTYQILIVGDYISEGWTPYVQQDLTGIATVTHAEVPGQVLEGDASSSIELAHMDSWLSQHHYDFVHLDAITDIDPCHDYLNDLPTYLDNLTKIIAKIRAAGAVPIFGTATPSYSNCHPEDKVVEYNAAAVQLMHSLNVKVDDDFAVVNNNRKAYMYAATFHLTDAGYQAVATSVVYSFGYIPY